MTLFSQVRYRLLLPILMLGISVNLMMLSSRIHLQGRGMEYADPAEVITGLINGPGYVSRINLPLSEDVHEVLGWQDGHLVGIALLWFLIGLGVDRKRLRRDLTREHSVSAMWLFSGAALFFGLMAYWGLVHLLNWKYYWWVLTTHPLQSEYTIWRGVGAWSLVLCIYFARKARAAKKNWRSHRHLEPQAINVTRP